jgi:hypothetical protein
MFRNLTTVTMIVLTVLYVHCNVRSMLKSSRGCCRRSYGSVVHGSKQSSLGSRSSRSSSSAFCRDNSSRGHVFEINPSILNLPGTDLCALLL